MCYTIYFNLDQLLFNWFKHFILFYCVKPNNLQHRGTGENNYTYGTHYNLLKYNRNLVSARNEEVLIWL